MGGRGARAKISRLSLDEYLGKLGLSSPISDFLLDKLRANTLLETERGKKRFEKEAARAADDYQEKRAAAISEYRKLVQTGKIKEPSALEKRLRTARGHEDNESTQAARRRLAKQGIDWRTGKRLR